MPRTSPLILLLCIAMPACGGEQPFDGLTPDAGNQGTQSEGSGDVAEPEERAEEDATTEAHAADAPTVVEDTLLADATLARESGDITDDSVEPDSTSPEEVDAEVDEGAGPVDDSASGPAETDVDGGASEDEADSDEDAASSEDTSTPADTGCTPACEGVACGDDGCGGTCGSCEAGSSCDESGACIDEVLSLEDAIEAVLVGVHGLDEMTVDVSVSEVDAQAAAYASTVDFISALEAAMVSFLTDDSDIESPLGIAYFVAEGSWDPNNAEGQTFEEATFEALVDHLNRPTASLALVPIGQTAEHGESVADAWIFFLTIDDLSDHLYWAIVDRQGIDGTYNYGFN